MKLPPRIFLVACAVLLIASSGMAQNIPLHNWTVPPYVSTQSSSGGLHTMTHIQGDVPGVFVPVEPCRLTDSRVSAGGPGPIAAATTRNYDFIPGGGTCPGTFSEPVLALSLNFSVVNTQGPGFILAYPTGQPAPGVSVLNYAGTPGEIRNNAAIVPVDANGSFSVTAGVSGTDVIIDINGIFLNVLESGTQLRIIGSPVDGVIRGDNTLTGTSGTGVIGTQAGSGWGVFGQVTGIVNGARGVYGLASGGSGYIFGVKGTTSSTSFDSAGVKGVGGAGDPFGDITDCGPCLTAGVRGVNTFGHGVLGISGGSAVTGVHVTGTTSQATGYLGFTSTTGVHSSVNITKSGTVSFVEPHPTDASKEIIYASLEGPEAGTYFRGRGKFQNGVATIEVPETFRIVSDPEGLSIQVTPIGAMATVAVLQIDLDRIVVLGSRNVDFFYTVNGIRRSQRDFSPIRDNEKDFVPTRGDATIPEGYSAEIRNRLIANGTYHPDGTINKETAHRLGWDRVWEERSRPQPQPVSDTP